MISQYTLTWMIVTEYMRHKWQRISSVCRYYNLVLSSFSSWLITGFVYVARVIQWVSLEEQKQSILPEHPRSPPVFHGVRVAQWFGLCVVCCKSFFVVLSFWPLYCLFFGLSFQYLHTVTLVGRLSNDPYVASSVHVKDRINHAQWQDTILLPPLHS